jgi:uncharacterized membrane protein YfcA
MIGLIVLTMFAVGLLLGFVGAGGSGFIIALLTVFFGFSIHTALATALAAMMFSTLSGAFSHYREGNISLKTGIIIIGIFGAMGAAGSSKFTSYIPAEELKWLTAGMLFLSGIVLWLLMFMVSQKNVSDSDSVILFSGAKFWVSAGGIGLVTGGLSGMFGIGSTPFIQVGLMVILGMSIRQAAGTTMLIIIPIAFAGGVSYYQLGYLDLQLLLGVVIGTMLGAYIGAKFTRIVPALYLKTAMVMTPMIGGALLVI